MSSLENCDEITRKDLDEFKELLTQSYELNRKIDDMKLWAYTLFNKYHLSLDNDGFSVRAFTSDMDSAIISTSELLKIEEYTGAKLISIRSFHYKFVWSEKLKKNKNKKND